MKKLMLFREELDASGGGGIPQGGLAASLMDDVPSTGTDTPSVPSTPAVSSSPMVDAAALAREFGQVLSQQRGPQQQQQAAPQMTREEARKQLGFLDINDEFLARYDNLESRKQAMSDLYENILSVATNITRAQAEAMRQEFTSQLEPATRFISDYEAKQKESRFNEQFPTLAKKEYSPIIGAIVGSLRQQNALTGDESKDFKLIADSMTSVLQQSNPNFQLAAPVAAKPHSALPNVSSGSGGGGGAPRAGSKNPSGSKAVALLS